MEEIRKSLGMNQRDFAEAIGTNLRTYHERLDGVRGWTLGEVVKAAELNGGAVTVETGEDLYNITIVKV